MKKTGWLWLLIAPACTWAMPNADIVQSVEVAAPVDQVFAAFTSDEGVQTFFAPGSNIDLRVGGAYEIYFFPERTPGERGAEEIQVLAIEPGERLSITWNAPPNWPQVRAQRTVVTFVFESLHQRATRVTLRHSLWGSGQDWSEVNQYFRKAWPVVLGRLQQRFEQGPIEW